MQKLYELSNTMLSYVELVLSLTCAMLPTIIMTVFNTV